MQGNFPKDYMSNLTLCIGDVLEEVVFENKLKIFEDALFKSSETSKHKMAKTGTLKELRTENGERKKTQLQWVSSV